MVYISIQNIPFASTLIACPEKKTTQKIAGVATAKSFMKKEEKGKKKRTGRDLKEGWKKIGEREGEKRCQRRVEEERRKRRKVVCRCM